MSSNLTYSIFEGTLTGVLNGRLIHIEALSGGSAGSTRTRHRATDAANNPYAEGLETSGPANSPLHIHGGPIPPGRYIIETPAHHGHLGLAARLTSGHQKAHERDGFFIHGRGPHGSDGCIVPLHLADFMVLMSSLSAESGGTLIVVETGSGDMFA